MSDDPALGPERGEAAYAVLRQIRPLHQLSARAIAAGLAGTRVTVAMRAVLERLHDDGPQTVPQIARSLWIARQGVQRIVDDARAEGYVVRRDNPGHARSKLIALTELGRAEFERLHADELGALADLAATIDIAELRGCAEVLERLVDAVRARDGADSEGPAEPSVAAADRG